MELSAVGERVFAAESIIKRRIRKVGPHHTLALRREGAVPAGQSSNPSACGGTQGRVEYLVKWKGWSPK